MSLESKQSTCTSGRQKWLLILSKLRLANQNQVWSLSLSLVAKKPSKAAN